MKILIVMDSFKGSLTSIEACNAAQRGVLRAATDIEITKIPMADGGEGTVEALVAARGGYIKKCKTTGVFGEEIDGFYGVINDGKTAVVETAAASGITLIKQHQLDPMRATTFGTGQIILNAINDGFKNIIIGLGGSATTDGGMGALQALGVRFLDKDSVELGKGGHALTKVCFIDKSKVTPKLDDVKITLACDVKNPLYGKEGAAYVFAPQKGAKEQDVKILDDGLKNYAQIVLETTGKDISELEGAGAAGGLCGGLIAFTDATILSGFEVLCQAAGLDEKIKNTDLIITGEGKTDIQTAYGKLPVGIAGVAKKYNKKVICISGTVLPCQQLYQSGIDAVFSIINRPMTLNDAMENAAVLLEQTCFDVIKCWW